MNYGHIEYFYFIYSFINAFIIHLLFNCLLGVRYGTRHTINGGKMCWHILECPTCLLDQTAV